MATDQLGSFDEVWNTVRRWSADERRSLASQLLASLAGDHAAPPAKTCAADLIGAWRDAGPLGDAAVQALLEEELVRKHG